MDAAARTPLAALATSPPTAVAMVVANEAVAKGSSPADGGTTELSVDRWLSGSNKTIPRACHGFESRLVTDADAPRGMRASPREARATSTMFSSLEHAWNRTQLPLEIRTLLICARYPEGSPPCF